MRLFFFVEEGQVSGKRERKLERWRRTLRAETAALALITIAQHRLGDMG